MPDQSLGRTSLTNAPAVAICVPVRNEEATLPLLIDALASLVVGRSAVTACFFLDSCTDRSEAVLNAARGALPCALHVVSGGAQPDANAGRARRAAVEIGIAALGGGGISGGGAIFTTDADSRPAADWLTAGLAALGQAEFVAGRITRRAAAGDAMQSRVEAYYDRVHAYRRRVDPVAWDAPDAHHFGGGANLAFHADAYRAIGGFRAVPSGEDATLLDDAARAGFRVRRDAAMLVETSSRRHGRAPQGLAAALRDSDAGGLPVVVHPAAHAWQYRAQADARNAWPMIDDRRVRVRLGETIGLTADHVLGVARDCPNAQAFAMRLVPAAADAARMVTLAEAEIALAALEAASCERAA